jgi:hypothetical protein
MATHDLYGLPRGDLEAVRIVAERALGSKFVARESSFVGEYYLLENPEGEMLQLQWNFDPYEEEWAEPEFRDMNVLFYVGNTTRAQELERLLTGAIPGLVLLRRDET